MDRTINHAQTPRLFSSYAWVAAMIRTRCTTCPCSVAMDTTVTRCRCPLSIHKRRPTAPTYSSCALLHVVVFAINILACISRILGGATSDERLHKTRFDSIRRIAYLLLPGTPRLLQPHQPYQGHAPTVGVLSKVWASLGTPS